VATDWSNLQFYTSQHEVLRGTALSTPHAQSCVRNFPVIGKAAKIYKYQLSNISWYLQVSAVADGPAKLGRKFVTLSVHLCCITANVLQQRWTLSVINLRPN